MTHFHRHLLMASATAVALAGCGGGGGTLTTIDGHVRLVNATGIATLDLYQSSSLLTRGVAANAVGPYADLPANTYTFNIDVGGSGATAATVTGAVQKKDDYTIVAYTSGGTLTAAYLPDSEGSPSSGTAKLRLFNADASDVPSVDAYMLTSACSGLASSPAAPLMTAVTGLQASYTQVNATSGGTVYHLCVTAAGDKSDLRLDIPSLTLTNGQIATVILTRSAGGVLLNGLVLNQQGSLTAAPNASARMRLAVGATGGALVTATANGVSLGTNLPAPAVGSYALVPSGPVTLTATVGGTAVAAPAFTAPPGADLTLLVAGTASTPPVLIADDNSASTSTANPVKLRLVNGMPGSGAAVLTDSFINVGNPAIVGTSSGYSQVQASAALALLQVSAGGTQLCQSANVTLTAGKVYTVFLLGAVPASPVACTISADR
ncbi:MAG: DUF4397 domain-containing protein [Pseudomonadota bacterium]|nr:DUF4397 domain-containing protein [Pseudomonadota bacterium]